MSFDKRLFDFWDQFLIRLFQFNIFCLTLTKFFWHEFLRPFFKIVSNRIHRSPTASLPQPLNNPLDANFRLGLQRSQVDFRGLRRLVGAVDAGEVF